MASHAEGGFTEASGIASHAEGQLTLALGSVSHAEGLSTTASGTASHTEGISALAAGRASHAAGHWAKALHDNTYIGADGQNSDFDSTASNQFLIRATGNVGINMNTPTSALHVAGTITADAFVGDGSELNPIYYHYKQDNPIDFPADEEYIGVIAQEVQRIEALGGRLADVEERLAGID